MVTMVTFRCVVGVFTVENEKTEYRLCYGDVEVNATMTSYENVCNSLE